MEALYILHFDRPLHHARHYAGATKNLQNRLVDHALGNGARITRELLLRRIGWQLARCWTIPWPWEQHLKKMKHTPDYCPICTTKPRDIPGCQEYPVSAIVLAGYPIHSSQLKEQS